MTNRPRISALLLLYALALGAREGYCQGTATCPPPFRTLRYDEDYSCLRDPSARTSVLDDFKYIPLGDDSYLSLGGEIRLRYDYTHNPTWGQDPQDANGAFLQRYVLGADLHVGSGIRLFVQFRSALENGRAGEPSPVEEGQFDLQQAFADLAIFETSASNLTLRLGRQEVAFGSERIVSVREGPTIHRSFDGLRGLLRVHGWAVDALGLLSVKNQPGVFQDETNSGQALWGVYAVSPELGAPRFNLDWYYLGYRNDQSTYATGSGRETRHSLGTRAWRKAHAWDWNWEAVYQFGSFAGGDISAWTTASDTGYTFEAVRWAPRAGLSANIASGDRHRGDNSLQTFNPLFPRGAYFDELGLLGPRNFFNVHPSVTVRPRSNVLLSGDVDFFWRLSRADGVYDPSGNILRDGTGSDARYVSTLLSGTAEWQVNRYLLLMLVYTHVFPGQFIRETGPHKDIDFVEVTTKVLF